MTRVLHRVVGESPPRAIGGKGCRIMTSDGAIYLDACGGAAVSSLGHGHPEVIEAIRAQAASIAYAHTSFFTSDAAEQLAEVLIDEAPPGLSHACFVSGGSEAVEAALKLARQYFVEIGDTSRRHIIARRQSYHGNTLGALAAGGNQRRRELFEPLLIETHHVDACFAYREQLTGEDDTAYAARAADSLEAKILELGPDTVMAFIAETVVGATAGAVPPVADYFKRVRNICDRYGVLLILDEVMCGMGRTGSLHACEQEGIAPDLLAVAKGLGGGYQPIGAVLVSRGIFDAIVNGSKTLQHGHTYMGHPIACAAALAVQKVIKRDHLLDNVKRMGLYLDARLREALGEHPNVGDIRGRGLLRALELVEDREKKTPFPTLQHLAVRVKLQAMKRGLLVYPMSGTADGQAGDHVLLAHPFIVDAPTVEETVERLQAAIGAAIAEGA